MTPLDLDPSFEPAYSVITSLSYMLWVSANANTFCYGNRLEDRSFTFLPLSMCSVCSLSWLVSGTFTLFSLSPSAAICLGINQQAHPGMPFPLLAGAGTYDLFSKIFVTASGGTL